MGMEWGKKIQEKSVDPWVEQPNINRYRKGQNSRCLFCLIPQPAWEGKGWRTTREQQVGDNLEEVEVSESTSLDKGQAGKAVRST